MPKKPCKEIVLRKNEVSESDFYYDILVMGDVVGKAVRKLTEVEKREKPKVTWVLHLDGENREKEFNSVRLIRSHMLHRMMRGQWDKSA